jgi:hypothetical protein
MPITKATSNAVAPAAKGDLVVGNATNDSGVLAVGSTDQVLTVDSSAATGLKWATASAGGMTLLSTTTMSGTSVTISSIPQTYNSLFVLITGITNNTGNEVFSVKPNNANVATYSQLDFSTITSYRDDILYMASQNRVVFRTPANNSWVLQINNYASTTSLKPFLSYGGYQDDFANNRAVSNFGNLGTTSQITSLVFNMNGQTITGGTILLYGVK